MTTDSHAEPKVNQILSVGIGVGDLEKSARFYTDVWGLQVVEQTEDKVLLRAAGLEHHVIALLRGRNPGLVGFTLGSSNRSEIEKLYERLKATGVQIESSPSILGTSGGGYGFSFRDPEHRLIAIVTGRNAHDKELSTETIPTKLAHLVMNSVDSSAAAKFMQESLGMRLSDQTGMMHFLRCNSDHHAVAYSKSTTTSLNHIAFELPNWNAMMYGIGRIKNAGHKVHWGIGRHGPGNNVFAYFIDPDGHVIEYTAEVQQIDESTHRVKTPAEWQRPKNLDSWGFADFPSEEVARRMQGILT